MPAGAEVGALPVPPLTVLPVPEQPLIRSALVVCVSSGPQEKPEVGVQFWAEAGSTPRERCLLGAADTGRCSPLAGTANAST
jgi:hypothetical protein